MGIEQELVRLRKQKGLSQLELAEALNVSRQAVSKWEQGISVPTTENLIRLGNLYGISIDELVNGGIDREGESSKVLNEQQLKQEPFQEPVKVKKGSTIKRVIKWIALIIGILFLGAMVFVLVLMR